MAPLLGRVGSRPKATGKSSTAQLNRDLGQSERKHGGE